ncbi:membrane transporter [Schizosaccharomyces cryophilus OY26]|uniref:Membrane transporter n=1 Tax=Schizosaccharomyces cryophilus (strain OY26 / ATCC MYA-4695 / CBS 11777 / NBRC 106824 / NRRL Y48691) TaxID=653667 RepID=S9WZC2_SCHCR|nr:membrane transporter [Schizosaccharomyces cryophilus OY26]EPY50067.1 membrane transporter [Schizosaccharomyces cryophilus OY26]
MSENIHIRDHRGIQSSFSSTDFSDEYVLAQTGSLQSSNSNQLNISPRVEESNFDNESIASTVKNHNKLPEAEFVATQPVSNKSNEGLHKTSMDKDEEQVSTKPLDGPLDDASSVNDVQFRPPSQERSIEQNPRRLERIKTRAFSFVTNKRFWIVFILGQVLSLCLTASNTFNGFLSEMGKVPAFQIFLFYAALTLMFTPYTIYRMGFKSYFEMVLRHGWKYILFAFFDVEGNYFVVLAYQYTSVISASLLDSWATVAVVILSFFFLKVRYHWSQLLGIVVCIGGLALLVVSDLKNYGSNEKSAKNPGLGDGYMILGATCYGLSNTIEEYFASKLPLYVVVGQMSLYASIISIVQNFIFDRKDFLHLHWTRAMGGYLAGFIIVMLILYSLAPICFLLTSDFWSLIIGIHVFGNHVYWLYPIAFVMIIIGLFVYHIFIDTADKASKPWLRQGEGVDGVGMVRRPSSSLFSMKNDMGKSEVIVAAHKDDEFFKRIRDSFSWMKHLFVKK